MDECGGRAETLCDQLGDPLTRQLVSGDLDRCRIRLPSRARFGSRGVYTGPAGSRAANATTIAERPGYIRFRTTSPLRPGEGFTVAVTWPKGVVRER